MGGGGVLQRRAVAVPRLDKRKEAVAPSGIVRPRQLCVVGGHIDALDEGIFISAILIAAIGRGGEDIGTQRADVLHTIRGFVQGDVVQIQLTLSTVETDINRRMGARIEGH